MCAVDEELTKEAIACLRDAKLGGRLTRLPLTRNQAKVGTNLPAPLEAIRVTDGQNEAEGDKRSNAGYLLKTLRLRVATIDQLKDQPIQFLNTGREFLDGEEQRL